MSPCGSHARSKPLSISVLPRVAHATEVSQELLLSPQMASCAQQLFFLVDLCSNKALIAWSLMGASLLVKRYNILPTLV